MGARGKDGAQEAGWEPAVLSLPLPSAPDRTGTLALGCPAPEV